MSEKIEKQLAEVIQSLHWMHERIDGVEKRIHALDGKKVSHSEPSEFSDEVDWVKTECKEERTTPHKPERSFEEVVGMRWLPAAGVVALVFGVAFFLKYAFDNNWIGETGRVVMGLTGGLGLLVLGDYLKSKYTLYAQILGGGGIALLYLSIYASYAWYDMIPATAALFIMGLVTFLSGFESVRLREPSLALLGVLGGFLTPLLLQNGATQIHVLFPYILMINLGVLAISFFEKWRHLNVLAFFGTLVLTFSSLSDFVGSDAAFVAYASLFFLVFVGATVSHNIVRKTMTDAFDAVLLTANSFAYFGVVAALYPGKDIELSFFAFGLALFYFFVSVFSHHHHKEDKTLPLFSSGLAVVFLTTSLGLMFEQQWLTIAWAVEALLFIWMSFELRVKSYRIFGLIVMMIVAWRLLLVEAGRLRITDFHVIFNSRFIVFMVSVLAMALAGYLYAKHKPDTSKEERVLLSVLIIAANFFVVMAMTLDVDSFYDVKRLNVSEQFVGEGRPNADLFDAIRNQRRFTTSVLWALYAALLVIVGFARKSRLLRVAGILFFLVTILKIFVFDLWALGQLYRILSSIGLGVVLLSTFFLYHKFKDRL